LYQVIWQEENKIEIALEGTLTVAEFQQVIHQLESLCTMYPHIHVLFDAVHLEKYDFKIILDEYELYRNYKAHLKRVALVSDRKFEMFLMKQLSKFLETEFRTFEGERIEEARKWIFPSKLP